MSYFELGHEFPKIILTLENQFLPLFLSQLEVVNLRVILRGDGLSHFIRKRIELSLWQLQSDYVNLQLCS